MTSKSLSFSESIQTTQSLMKRIETEGLTEIDIKREVINIVSTKNGGRGFFVAYLTGDSSLGDFPSQGIIDGLRASIEVANELLVKNLAMSSAMAIIHSRNNNLSNVEGSQRVSQRTSNLIKKIEADSITEELKKLQNTISTGEGEYQSFLERWKYDEEQKQAIKRATLDTLNNQE